MSFTEHTQNCSCGRFFEQHPTTIDGVEGESLERMVEQIRTGTCYCFLSRDSHNPLNVATKLAGKTLLHAAAAAGYDTAEIVQYLLEHKCSVNKVRSLSAVEIQGKLHVVFSP